MGFLLYSSILAFVMAKRFILKGIYLSSLYISIVQDTYDATCTRIIGGRSNQKRNLHVLTLDLQQ